MGNCCLTAKFSTVVRSNRLTTLYPARPNFAVRSAAADQTPQRGKSIMGLYATEVVRQWLDVTGGVEASELFPALLSKSESIYEVEISTEDDARPGKYDGYEQDVPEEIKEQAELEAEQEFHHEALDAAKSFLRGIAPATSILREDFEEREQKELEEAAKLSGIDVPWDVAESASIQAEEEARIRKLEAEKKVGAEDLEQANAMIPWGGSLPAYPHLSPG